jgi:hypothetical protein
MAAWRQALEWCPKTAVSLGGLGESDSLVRWSSEACEAHPAKLELLEFGSSREKDSTYYRYRLNTRAGAEM